MKGMWSPSRRTRILLGCLLNLEGKLAMSPLHMYNVSKVLFLLKLFNVISFVFIFVVVLRCVSCARCVVLRSFVFSKNLIRTKKLKRMKRNSAGLGSPKVQSARVLLKVVMLGTLTLFYNFRSLSINN